MWGCDSTVTLLLRVITVNVEVYQQGASLFALASNAEFQWLNCSINMKPIQGAIYQEFTPISDGWYAVQVTQEGCTDTSECYEVMGVFAYHQISSETLNISPNPSNGDVLIDTRWEIAFELSNFAGQIILKKTLTPGKHRLNLSDYSPGIYYFRFYNSQINITRPLIINP